MIKIDLDQPFDIAVSHRINFATGDFIESDKDDIERHKERKREVVEESELIKYHNEKILSVSILQDTINAFDNYNILITTEEDNERAYQYLIKGHIDFIDMDYNLAFYEKHRQPNENN